MRRASGIGTGIRRVVQLVFLLAFFGLMVLARPQPEASQEAWHTPHPAVQAFFWFDPLLLAVTWLAVRAVPALLWTAAATLVMTVLLGRVFCGWICPLGTIHAMAGWVFDRLGRSRHKPRDHWSRWQLAKYYVLAAGLAMAVFGGHWLCVADPLVLLYRTAATAIFPAAQYGVEELSTAAFQSDPAIGPVHLKTATEPAYAYLRDHVFSVPHQAYVGSGLIVGLFLLTVAMNAYRRRFWCRYLCPLGALLGVFAWRPWLRRAVDETACNHCDVCAQGCHGAAANTPGGQYKPAECLGCLNCTDSCRRQSVAFRWVWPWSKRPVAESVDVSRRATLAAAVGGVVTLGLLRSTPQSRGKTYHPDLIRPPGSRGEREFLQRCTGCGLCLKICPTGGLQPTFLEAGLEGIWTPRLVPKIGHCDYNCNLCGQVCPTQAIQPLTVDEKHAVKIGLASFDVTRCIPYAYGTDCTVCEEHCPIPDKAIFCLEVEVTARDGSKNTLKQPHVDTTKCIGCGICENVCPFKDHPGIRVRSACETRHPENQPILW